MNEEAQAIQNQIDALAKQRDKLRGNYIKICGYCYHDDHKTFARHQKLSPHCHIEAWPCPLGIYDSEWARGKDGRWNPVSDT